MCTDPLPYICRIEKSREIFPGIADSPALSGQSTNPGAKNFSLSAYGLFHPYDIHHDTESISLPDQPATFIKTMHSSPLPLFTDCFPLTGRDLIQYEKLLKACFENFFEFTAHSLSFPTTLPDAMLPQDGSTTLLPVLTEDRLFVPLELDEKLLGVFEARGIDHNTVAAARAFIPGIARMALTNIRLYRAGISDPLTGLHNSFFLQSAMEKEIQAILGSILPGPESSVDSAYRACFGLIHLDLDSFKRINARFGYFFGDTLIAGIGKEIREIAPEQTLVCRTAGAAFIIFWPQASPAKCAKLSRQITTHIAETIYTCPISKERLDLTCTVGYATYPRDMQGAQFQRPPGEQARIILEKAQKAADTAKIQGGNTIFSFADILKQGGRIIENLPLNRVLVNVGRSSDMSEGMRFLVWSRDHGASNPVTGSTPGEVLGHYPPMYKGEILIQDVQEEISVGEVLYLNDPSWSIESGDKLTLTGEEAGADGSHSGTPVSPCIQKDVLTGLYPLRDFIASWTRARTECTLFAQALIRIRNSREDENPDLPPPEKTLQTLLFLIKTFFGPDALGGRYSTNCLIYFFPDLDQATGICKARDLCTAFAEKTGGELHIGMAGYPCLHFAKSDILENTKKALDHAALLPQPRAAFFDSVSLNISADRLFTRGEIYGALDEYQWALTADPGNLLARNSLGICYARLGRMEQAKEQFQTVLATDRNNLMTLYNYGCACLKTMEEEKAKNAFETCLVHNPEHTFSLLRLGQMAEKNNDPDRAWEIYERAGTTPDGKGMAARHLAELALQRGEKDKGREFLHQALIFDPGDALSLNLLARLYLDRGDDPEIAEDLARQSVHLRPDIPSLWTEVARALEARGKTEEAQTAKMRSLASHT